VAVTAAATAVSPGSRPREAEGVLDEIAGGGPDESP
jgi:hypothetical protein